MNSNIFTRENKKECLPQMKSMNNYYIWYGLSLTEKYQNAQRNKVSTSDKFILVDKIKWNWNILKQ